MYSCVLLPLAINFTFSVLYLFTQTRDMSVEENVLRLHVKVKSRYSKYTNAHANRLHFFFNTTQNLNEPQFRYTCIHNNFG